MDEGGKGWSTKLQSQVQVQSNWGPWPPYRSWHFMV